MSTRAPLWAPAGRSRQAVKVAAVDDIESRRPGPGARGRRPSWPAACRSATRLPGQAQRRVAGGQRDRVREAAAGRHQPQRPGHRHPRQTGSLRSRGQAAGVLQRQCPTTAPSGVTSTTARRHRRTFPRRRVAQKRSCRSPDWALPASGMGTIRRSRRPCAGRPFRRPRATRPSRGRPRRPNG